VDAPRHAEGLPAEEKKRHHALVQEELQRLDDDISETQQRIFECRCVLINIYVWDTCNFLNAFCFQNFSAPENLPCEVSIEPSLEKLASGYERQPPLQYFAGCVLAYHNLVIVVC
jgi:hypothetical protein